jgi:hypothetical protein
MSEAFQLVDPQSAREYLKLCGAGARNRGDVLFRRNSVQDLTPERPGFRYSALIKADREYRVGLEYDETEGWMGDCSCPQEIDCEHVCAAMRALLAEHSAAEVRNLSAGRTSAAAGVGRAPRKTDEPSLGVARRLMAALGRPLNALETRFVRKIETAFTRCQESRRITQWDFHDLGLPLQGYGWDALQIWPSFPADEYEFWLYVANAAREHHAAYPDFMAPITDLGVIEERLAKWRRAREIEKWKQTLGNVRAQGISARPVNAGEIDLRVVIDEKEAFLEFRRPGQEEFQPLKSPQFNQYSRDYGEGVVLFTQEAELLWQLFSQRLYTGSAPQLRYYDNEAAAALRRLLRLRSLDSRVVTRARQPLARPEQPLHWELMPASDESDDYRLRLVQADGAPAPPILCTLAGSPTLYLTGSAVFNGPNPQHHVLDPKQENRIPAPALERAAGVAFLQSIDVELPQRLRDRVRVLPYQVAITCRLESTYPGSTAEDCLLAVLAEAPDGHQQAWGGYNWFPSGPAGRRQREPGHGQITIYDSSMIEKVPRLLEPLGLRASSYGNGLCMRVTKKFPELFCTWLKSVPPEITVHLDGELASLASTDVAGRVKLDVTETAIDWFDLRVVLDVADTSLTQEEIKLLLKAKGGYVRLKGKGWRRLQFDLSAEEDERLARLGLSPRELTDEPQRLHALQLADDSAKRFLPEQQVQQIQRRANEIKARVAPNLPADVTAELRPYQLEGFHFLAYLSTNSFGGILADDMGLGKTLQTLAWLVWLGGNGHRTSSSSSASSFSSSSEKEAEAEADENPRPSLVVCPKSVMDNWQAEARRFTPNLRVKVWPASELSNFEKRLSEADLHVLNYSQLRLLGESLSPVPWRVVILDEGQYIKNPSSQTAQIARSLRAEHRLVLSGTPIENRLLDLWSLLAFAMPGVLGSRAQFAKLYDAKGDPFARRRLASRVRPFLLRRTKAQVAKELPDRVEEDLFCEIEGEQKTLYRAELKRAQQLLLGISTQKELAKQQFHFLTSLLRLRQICCHPRLVSPDCMAPSAKSEALLEQLEPLMEEGHKVLVFSQFVELLGLLRPLISARGWPHFYLAGDTENRGRLVNEFQSASGAAVFLISLKAGGFGLNLTAANYVVLFDPWWNPAVENQAIDRTHRIGQVNKVMAYRLLIKDSIEEKIRALQKQKKALAEDVLGEERFAQSLTLDDLRFLFAD